MGEAEHQEPEIGRDAGEGDPPHPPRQHATATAVIDENRLCSAHDSAIARRG